MTLHGLGFKVDGANIGELGPGDSIGVGLAALLSGAKSYTGLDLVPFSAKADLLTILDRLVQMYSQRTSIPDQNEFPRVLPRLDSYEFPGKAISGVAFADKVEQIRAELRKGMNSGCLLHYHAPWPSNHDVPVASLDLVFSQAVLEHLDNLEGTYKAMFSWLRSGGYASHSIDFSVHYLSPFWNGHWSYSDWQWRMVRGRREFLLNRDP